MSTVAALMGWGAAIGAGIMAGVYFAFSSFIMKALGRLPRAEGVSAMHAINDVIVSSAFMPLFFGSTVLHLGLACYAGLRWGEPGSSTLMFGCALYVLGMFAVTVLRNVPLNDALKAVAPTAVEAETLWSRYLDRWVLWNHVRTVACAVASGLLAFALTR